MFIHIVKENETLNHILVSYSVTKNELISLNMHITDWSKLQTGMKLKIPMINENIKEVLDETEPFVQEYYDTGLFKEIQKKENIEKNQIISDNPVIIESPDLSVENAQIQPETLEVEELANKDDLIENEAISEYFEALKEKAEERITVTPSPVTDNKTSYVFTDEYLAQYYDYHFRMYYYKFMSYEEYIREVNRDFKNTFTK